MSDKELGKQFAKEAMQSLDVAALSFVVLAQSDQIDDVTITENYTLFPVWNANWTGRAGTIVQDDGQLFRSIHDITNVGQNTKPSATPAMWTRIGNPAEEFPEWIQPLGAHDAYPLGAKVTHNGRRWISTANGNIWQPGVFGWEEVT